MENGLNLFDFLVISLYVVGLVIVGFRVGMNRDGAQDYFLAGKSLNWKTIGLSIFGTNISPMMLISSSGVAYAYGMVANNFEWLAWIFLILMAMLFLPHYLSTKVFTMPEFIQKRFGNASRDLLSWIVFIQITIGVGSVLYAGSILMGQLMDWPLWLSLLLMTLLSASFTITGGLKAVAITDAFQSVLMILACAVLTAIGLAKVGSLEALYNSVPKAHWKLFRPASDSAYPWPAIVFGYPVMAIWYWCTNQTIVQRALGAKNLREAQKGILFTGYLKILVPLIFFFPGLLCLALHPGLEDSDEAFMTMVLNYLPHGMIGLIVAMLMAALVSTVNSMLNSASTVFTLDIYQNKINAQASSKQLKKIGQIITALVALIAFFIAFGLDAVEGMNLFDLVNSIFSFLSPSLAVVFLLGILWKKATSQAAYYTLLFGNIPSIVIGICYLADWPSKDFWPHFLLIAVYLFIGLFVFMVVVSLLTQKSSLTTKFPTLSDAYASIAEKYNNSSLWWGWGILACIMISLYLTFELIV